MSLEHVTQSVMRQDFKSTQGQHNSPRGLRRLGAVAALLGVCAGGILLFSGNDADARHTEPADAISEARAEAEAVVPASSSRISLPLDLPEGDASATAEESINAPAEPKLTWQTTQVRAGDSLARIFSRLGISAGELDRLMRAGGDVARLKRIMPGQTLRVAMDGERLQALDYRFDRLNTLHVTRSDGAFHSRTDTRQLETRIASASGRIDSSLFLSGMQAGLSDNLIMELAGIFGWDIDFALDIRAGDRFTLLYEEQYLDGEKLRDGAVLAAEFTNRGKTYRALRYTDPRGRSDYYSPDGRSMRKAFLRTPVDFTRISSRFGSRFHPTLKKKKNHHGVDYAAPTGTPIKAAGDGKIVFRGRKGGYGNTVIIQHGGKYSTLYAHMSRFKPKLRSGSRVRQGQTIGYVGSTGRSTGPHLHYEFRVNGVHRNPLTVRLPDAAPIQAKYRADFLAKTRVLISQLDMLSRTTLARNDHNHD